MRIARFVLDSDPQYGVVNPEGTAISPILGDPFYTDIRPMGTEHRLEDVRLLAPIIPRSKIVGVGRNYPDHVAEMGSPTTRAPLIFLIPNTAVVGPGDPISIPEFTQSLSYEAELCLVVGRICKAVPPERAHEVIFGYTCGNDLTARDIQATDSQWARAKGFDGAAPLGPWIETELDPSPLRIEGRLNGELVQEGSTDHMIWSIPELIAHISGAFTLLPGDVIMTGTPAGVGRLNPGDQYEVSIQGIGTLSNTFRAPD